MEVVVKNSGPFTLSNALLLEKKGEWLKALQLYEALLKKASSDLRILSRLMIVSRKLKKYRKEIEYINKAIRVYEQKYERLKPKDTKVIAISKQLNVLLGHTDRKGKNLLAIPEVEQLKKRKTVAAKRMQ